MRWAWLLLVLFACGESAPSGSGPSGPFDPRPFEPEDPETDAGEAIDASSSDEDAGVVHDILGTLASGACGVVKTQIGAPTPSLETNLLVFVAGEEYTRSALSLGGQAIYDAPNAGGSSKESEVMSFEVLHVCEGAVLLKTETDIKYQPPDAGSNAITDMLVSIDGKKVGVSVTRIYTPGGMSDMQVKTTVEGKLADVKRSSERVLPEDKWVKQILHVFSPNKAATDALGRVWPTIPADTKADTITLVTETKGGGFLYCNPDPPLGSECQ